MFLPGSNWSENSCESRGERRQYQHHPSLGSEVVAHPKDRSMSPDPKPGQLHALVRAARAGSNAALGELLETFRSYLLLIANREVEANLRPKFAPSDMVQETILVAQLQFDQFRGQSAEEVAGWLRSILLHRMI